MPYEAIIKVTSWFLMFGLSIRAINELVNLTTRPGLSILPPFGREYRVVLQSSEL